MAQILFCKECNNMLYPREDYNMVQLNYHCKNCDQEILAPMALITTNDLRERKTKITASTVPNDIILDPSMPHTPSNVSHQWKCPSCGFNDAVFFSSTGEGTEETAMRLYFVCCNSICRKIFKQKLVKTDHISDFIEMNEDIDGIPEIDFQIF